jgi:hypothetical protein
MLRAGRMGRCSASYQRIMGLFFFLASDGRFLYIAGLL